MATEYTYLTDRQMQHIKHAPSKNLAHDSLGTRSVRTFVPILHRGRSVYVDVKTYSLYDATTGECLSSRQMRIVLDAEAKVTARRADLSVREGVGRMNDKRKAA